MKLVFLLVGLSPLTGCSAFTPVKDTAANHMLDPLVARRVLTNPSPAIAVNRPYLPGYLDRQQLVTREEGILRISNLNLWAEPLDSAIARVIANNLSRLTGSTNIQPLESFVSLDYTMLLELRIDRFEPDDSGRMNFEGTWKLQPVSGGETTTHFYRINVGISQSSTSADVRVDAMNQCLSDLAHQINNHL